MTLSDEELRRRLESIAATAPTVDLAAAARTVASAPQPPGIARRTRLVGVASAAASVAVALAIVGSFALRGDAPALKSPDASSAASVYASPTDSPGADRWMDLVWERTDPGPFARAGTTLMTDGVADGNGFLAVGNTRDAEDKSHQLWRSPDGRTWTAVDGAWPATAHVDRILNFGTGFIVISRQVVPDPTTAQSSALDRVWWSKDGMDWVERTPGASEGLVFDSAVAAAGPSGLLIHARDLRDNQYWLRSDSQLNWTRIDAAWPEDSGVFGVATGGPGWLAFGATGVGSPTTTGTIWTSADAVTWAPATVDHPGGSINDVRSIGNRLVALGSQRGLRCDACFGSLVFGLDLVTWVSSDGRTWQRASEREVGSVVVPNDIGLTSGLVTAGLDRMLTLDSASDGRLRIFETLDGFAWSEVGVRNGQPYDGGGLAGLPDLNAPVIVGRHGLVTFGRSGSGTLQPMYAEGASSVRLNLPTFDPPPERVGNDVMCPNQEPCGP